MGDLSAHFSSSEFACHHCGVVKTPPAELVAALERLRVAKGRPVRILSGYRCPVHNRAVGGATHSRHLVGDAADLFDDLRVTVAEAQAAGFRGIGHRRAAPHRVIHVDMRPTRAVFVDG